MWIMYVKYYYIPPTCQQSNAFEIIKYIDFAYVQIRMQIGKLHGSGEIVQSWSQIVIWKVISRFENRARGFLEFRETMRLLRRNYETE